MNPATSFRAVVFAAVLSTPILAVSFALSQEQVQTYPETKAVLLETHRDEMRALTSYRTFADTAVDEGYPKIAALFNALSASETVHARNMKDVLAELGVTVWEKPPELEASTTRENLKKAMAVELSEIDKSYPAYIERITPEGYQPAVDVLTYSWKSEMQHRKLLEKIHDNVGMFFGVVARKIEEAPSSYHVCDVCGSTTREQPEGDCGICGEEASHSHEVPAISPAP